MKTAEEKAKEYVENHGVYSNEYYTDKPGLKSAFLTGYKEAMKDTAMINIKTGMTYSCTHVPTGEKWVILGVRPDYSDVCAAGYPPSIAKFSDCIDWKEEREITSEELNHRHKKFGDNWI